MFFDHFRVDNTNYYYHLGLIAPIQNFKRLTP